MLFNPFMLSLLDQVWGIMVNPYLADLVERVNVTVLSRGDEWDKLRWKYICLVMDWVGDDLKTNIAINFIPPFEGVEL